jgi:hypothetical protein
VKPGRHKKVKVIRRLGEALYPDYVEPKVQRHIRWMFWGGAFQGFRGKDLAYFRRRDRAQLSQRLIMRILCL